MQVAAVMTGDTDLHRRPQYGARLTGIAVALAEVDPVRAKALGKRDAVIDDEGGVGIGADALKRFGEPRQLMFFHAFDAQLERRDGPGRKCRLSRSGKPPPTSWGLIR
jgi:hypothetical protein